MNTAYCNALSRTTGTMCTRNTNPVRTGKKQTAGSAQRPDPTPADRRNFEEKPMRRLTQALYVLFAAVMASGCSMMAPQYSPSIDNVQILKDAGVAASKLGKFDASPAQVNVNGISLRGSTLQSPYANSYALYLAEAIRQELILAGKLGADSSIEISGTLLKNDIDVSGVSIGTGDMEARFVVRKGESKLYDKIKTVHSEWESSFAGAVALPRGQQEYPRLVQRLLAALYADPDFLKALK